MLELVALSVLSYVCGAHARLAAVAVPALIAAAVMITEPAWVPVTLAAAGPWLVGRAVRSRRELVAALAERTRELEAERDTFTDLAVRHERARVARELHDIVAHHLAVIVVQAGAGRMAVHDPPERAAQRLSSIRDAGRGALVEMARLVDVLGEGERHDRRERLRLLLDRARAAGLTVRATPLPSAIDLSRELDDVAHRIVQEGITNAIKYAPGADVDVRLALVDGSLEVEVRDRGGRSQPTLAQTGAGLGLDGLCERVAAAGGQLDAGPAPGGGWRVYATLPWTPEGAREVRPGGRRHQAPPAVDSAAWNSSPPSSSPARSATCHEAPGAGSSST